MDFNEFHNGLRILCWNIERREVPWMTTYQWMAFNKDAPEFFVRANDADAQRIWAVIKARQPKRSKPGDDVDDLPDDEPPTYDEALGAKCDADARYVRDMMDAGRGHLLRK